MALSNIFREPRREITESVVGLSVVGLLVYADYRFAAWLNEIVINDRHEPLPLPLGMVFGLVCLLVIYLALAFTHTIGDTICDALDDAGVHLRPRDRR